MPHFISIQNLQDAGLDIYARLSEVQLLRYREPKPGIFIAESPIVVERALAAGYRPISVLMDEAGVPKQQGLLEVCGEIPVYTARFDVLTQITGFKLTRGMLCAMERNELPQADILCRDMYRIAVLEDVMNPTNVGAIFRSAAALGMDAVLLTHGCADPLYRRAIRVSMGTVFQIPWTYLPKSEEDTAQALHTLGFPCVAMALRDDSCEICDPRFAKLDKLAVILGTEGEGLRQETITHSDYTVKIPMTLGVTLVVVFVTYFSIVLGELVPKRLGQSRPEALASVVARPLHLLSLIMSPFVKLLSFSTKFVLKVLRLDKGEEAGVTQEEIHAMIEEGSASGAIEESERDMVRNVFRLDERQVGSVMTPRSDIEWIDLQDSTEENVKKLLTSKRSRLVVASGSLSDVKGICSTRSLLQQIVDKKEIDFTQNLLPAVYVPESLSGMELLEHFKSTIVPLSLVVDEFGEVVGLVTPRDVLEAIAGEFQAETEDERMAIERPDGSWFLDGIIAIPELKDTLGIKEVPEEEQGRYNTLAGMMMLLLQRLPKTGDRVSWENWDFEVADMDGRRIDKVLATPQVVTAEPEGKA